MSASHEAVPVAGGHVIENPLSGERITILAAADRRRACSSGNWCSPPAGGCRAATLIREQEECFTVLAGQMRFRIGGRRVIAGPGDTVRVPPGTVHHFANAGSQPGQGRGADQAGAEHAGAAGNRGGAWPPEQHAAARRVPSLMDLALFMRDFERGGAGAVSPGRAGPRRHPPARLAGQAARGSSARYRRLRYPDAGRGR